MNGGMMKRIVLLCLLALATRVMAAPPAEDYPVTVHVSSSHFSNDYRNQNLEVTIDGKKYELRQVGSAPTALLALGDYKARLITDEHRTSYESSRAYELLLPDKKTRKFNVTGQSE
jgi:hypothetical protein